MQMVMGAHRAQDPERGERCRCLLDNAFFGAALEVSTDRVEDRPQLLTNYVVGSRHLERGDMQQTIQVGLLRQAVQEKGHDPRHLNGRILVPGQTQLQLSSQLYPAQTRILGRAEKIRLVQKITEQGGISKRRGL